MAGLLEGFVEKSPSALMGAFDFAQALMADGPDFQKGYSAGSASIVTVERGRSEGIAINEVALGEALGFSVEAEQLLKAVRS